MTTQTTQQVNAHQLKQLLSAAWLASQVDCKPRNVLINGQPGIGKTEIINQVCADIEFTHVAGRRDVDIEARRPTVHVRTSHVAVMEPPDFKGLPWPDAEKGVANFMVFGDLAFVINFGKTNPDDVLVWFFDDFGHGAESVQKALMQLLGARRIGEHAIPDNVILVAATNSRTDKAGVRGLLEPIKSRFMCIVELIAEFDPWVEWAIDNGIRPEIIANLRFAPNLFHDFKPTADLTNGPCPRTWAKANDVLNLPLDEATRLAALAGCVGEAAATQTMSFLQMWGLLPTVDSIIADPDNAEIPTEPSAQLAISVAVATRASRETIGAICTYATRLHDEAGRGEYAAFLINDALRRCPEVQETQAFIKFASGPLASLLHGDRAA